MSERSVKPTSRKRKEARQQGRVAVSSLIVGSMVWVGASLAVTALGGPIIRAAIDTITHLWSAPPNTNLELALQDARQASLRAIFLIGACVAAAFAVAVLARVAQIGFIWAPNRIGSGNQASLGHRVSQLFSWDKSVVALRGVAVFAVFGSLLGGILWFEKESIGRQLVSRDATFASMNWLAEWGLLIGGCLFAIGLLDYAYQRYRFEQSLHMTPDELRAEVQAVQANPQIGAGRRRLQQDLHSTTDGSGHRSS